MTSRSFRLFLFAAALVGAPLAVASPALADFRLCNNTSGRVGVAVGYRDQQGWLTEGWWNVSARSCETILKGALAARYYYIYAVDYDQGGEWSGSAFMCTRDKEFTIRGFENCLARGYERTGFFEIDTLEQKSWTVQLSEQARNDGRPNAGSPTSDAPTQAAPGEAPPPAPPPAAPPPAAGSPGGQPGAPGTSAAPPASSPPSAAPSSPPSAK